MCNYKTIGKKPRILLIGPVTNVPANLIGGATISFGYLMDYLNGNGWRYKLVNTKRFPSGILSLLNPLYILLKVFICMPGSDVLFLNSSRGGTRYLAPIVYYLARIFGKKFVFRPFGGDIKDYTKKYSPFQQKLFAKTILKSDIFFLQTKELLEHYKSSGAHVKQLVTSRKAPATEFLRGSRPYKKRFIYLGFINKPKGIEHIVEAAKALGADYTVHIYGPIKDPAVRKFMEQGDLYQGVLEKEKVLQTLSEYDVLMLPTFYEGEGYPGVIIEAYSLGLPVIATQWKAIPEIVQHGKTGRLIKPKSTAALIEAMQYFDATNFKEYSEAARYYFNTTFSMDQVNSQVMEEITGLFYPQNEIVNQQ